VKTIIVWFRNDLRAHDHPALAAAIANGTHILPLFICDDNLLKGQHSSPNRNRFLAESLADLRQSLQTMGGDLIIRQGKALRVLAELCSTYKATEIYCTEDFTPYATKRDAIITRELAKKDMHLRQFPGRLIIDDPSTLKTKTGGAYKVFTPFWRQWQQQTRRAIAAKPQKLLLPKGIEPGVLPQLFHGDDVNLSPAVIQGGETAGRKRLREFIHGDIATYRATHDVLSVDTSRLSAYFHFGCISSREAESLLPEGEAAAAWHRQLAWRDFYHYILLAYPSNTEQEFQERYRAMHWSYNEAALEAWKQGKTGFPVVDAAMRQLQQQGWMHNRARLIVGSFLTKDLLLDWRLGEAHFMRLLVDGDTANNNGNWQWIASVGVDPAPLFRRLYNPTSQQQKYDPNGAYVRAYVPELAHVPDEYLAEPWKMPPSLQAKYQCRIGVDYPTPIVDHAVARKAALEHYLV